MSRLALESSVSVLHQEGGLPQANMQWHGDEASEDWCVHAQPAVWCYWSRGPCRWGGDKS